MDVDTGAAVSILSEKEFRKKFQSSRLEPSSLALKTYTGERMKVLGTFQGKVCYLDQGPFNLSMIVVGGDGPCLMGRNWLEVIRLDWSSIATVVNDSALQAVLDEHSDVFAKELGVIRPFKATLSLVENAKPRFHRARPIPFALKSGVEEALDQLESNGVSATVSGLPLLLLSRKKMLAFVSVGITRLP